MNFTELFNLTKIKVGDILSHPDGQKITILSIKEDSVEFKKHDIFHPAPCSQFLRFPTETEEDKCPTVASSKITIQRIS